jgi:hypothetical protein
MGRYFGGRARRFFKTRKLAVPSCAVLLLVTVMLASRDVSAAVYQVQLLNEAPLQATGWGIFGNSTLGTDHQGAVLWASPSGPPVSLHPTGFISSEGRDIYGTMQVGVGRIAGGEQHALLWAGTAESVVDLHPPGYYLTTASAVSDTAQAGAGRTAVDAPYHALLWRGIAESVVDLHVPIYSGTYVWDAVGDGQVGWGSFGPANFPSSYHALLWYGSADSLVDLHPPGYRMTIARGGGAGVQVGYGVTEDRPTIAHALLWRGTAESVVDLHPAGFEFSSAGAAAGTWQVGIGTRSDVSGDRALAWSGSAESVIDLHERLEEETGISFRFSLTTDVDTFGNVVGWGDSEDGIRYAIRWSIVPEPCSCCLAVSAALIAMRSRFRPKLQ